MSSGGCRAACGRPSGSGRSTWSSPQHPRWPRQALEIKKEATWIPGDDSAAAPEPVPPGLIYLHLEDPKEQLAKGLATLPGELQKWINQAMILNQPKTRARCRWSRSG